MAIQKQLNLLRQGVDAWNTWRRQHEKVQPDLSGADLRRADLSQAILISADLSYADLSNADLSYADLRGADFSYAHLSYANLKGADFSYAHLDGADLSYAHISDADLSNANLSNANLSNADFNYANFSDADLSEADFSEACIGWITFGNVDLRTVKGLETIAHRGPSTIGTNTISRSGGDIPEVFLRGAGLPDTFITYTRSLAQNRIEYYTCFISYSSKDQNFAERLYADLQNKGVRCWFAPENLKIGEKFWHRIEESIRLYDKLLVVLSEHSVNSDWVENEVMAALEKEQHNNKLVLFPIKLDEMVMHTNFPWAANIRRARHIGDFTNWKQHDEYQKALTRLIRDLQPETPPKNVQ